MRRSPRNRRIRITLLATACCAVWLWVGVAAGQQPYSPDPAAGVSLFEIYCAGCHVGDVGGSGQTPPLKGSAWVMGAEHRLIRIVLHGVRGPIEVGGNTYDLQMPRLGHQLTDAEIASLLSYVRRRFGGVETSIRPETVTTVRAAHGARTVPWTAEELLVERP